MPGTLYLVATPIGNLQDITARALNVLRTVDLIACEDTRHTRKLLTYYRITNKLVSYHEHNEQERADELADVLVSGRSVAVVTDAGMPGIADPGYRIVDRCAEIGAAVVPVPGASAFVIAAAASGLPTDSIFFGGFLPSKKGERRRRLEEVRDVPATLTFYESPRRVGKALADCLDVLGNRQAVVARELTKLHEEFIRGTLAELVEVMDNREVKGEIVLLIARSSPLAADRIVDASANNVVARIAELEASGATSKAALKQAAKEFDLPKAAAYKLLVESKRAQ